MLLPRVPAIAIIAGIITGDAVAMTIFGASVDVAGLNPGLIGLIANAAIVALVTALRPRPAEPSLASRLRAEAL